MSSSLFNFFHSIKNKSTVLFCGCFLLISIGCQKENNFTTAYKSNFSNPKQTTLPELEYSANNINEWKVFNNRIECLVSNEERKIHLLTRKLANQNGDLEMKVRLGFFNDKISSLNKNWAGFHIGSNTSFENSSTLQKKGINIGMCTNGALFIGAPSPNHKNPIIINALKKGVDLKISISNHLNNYTIDFSVLDSTNGKVLARISKKDIAPEQITGDLGLISNFENSEMIISKPTKSVWFQDWEIKGSKVALLTK